MKKMNIGRFAALAVAIVTLSADAAPTVGRVLVRQQWPWKEDVRIEYELTGAAGPVDVTCTVSQGETALAVPLNAFTGDCYGVEGNGLHAMTFSPQKAFKAGDIPECELSFSLTATEQTAASKSREVLYKVFDLVDNNVCTDITRGELLNGKYGPVETDFGAIGEGYATALPDVCIWTGVTNDPKYATTKLVVRKIDKGSFKIFQYPKQRNMPQTDTINLTEDYWIGVFEFTFAQCRAIGYTFSDATLDARQVVGRGDRHPFCSFTSYELWSAGKDHRDTNIRWDNTSNWILTKLYQRTGVKFVPPTVARWHKAYRAGTETYYYDGLFTETPENTASNEYANVLGLYRYNGGLTENADGSVTTNGTCAVGQFRPNAYGLSDMFGNAAEVSHDGGYSSNWPTTYTEDWVCALDDVGFPAYYGSWYGGTATSSGNNFWACQQLFSSTANFVGHGFRVCIGDSYFQPESAE